MKHYVLDTGFFVISRYYYPRTFPSFWEKIDEMVRSLRVSSVQEVLQELEAYGGEQGYLSDWIKNNKGIFTQLTPEEQSKKAEMMKVDIFQELVKVQVRLKGRLMADPFIIAKAAVRGGIVVTRELSSKIANNKPGKIRIPDVCDHFSIPCISPQEFMEQRDWKF